ncbi:hypothetical protein [Delftia lacustris]|uniref:hypothetical protein n=1 Tax=Delftia lacustris TaxID=558537 RepID=UPI002859C49D|nr:hypothetical protein [Delftia lacustris]MDR6731961.1 hypothetical protein [Delftia lacustris]
MLQRTVLAVLICVGAGVSAQTVYRCGNAYSDEPCKGRAVVDVRPTEGAHSMSGQKRVGNEATTRQMWRNVDKALQPLTGISPEEGERQREERRYKSIPRIKIDP